MKAKEIRAMSNEDLEAKLEELKKELMKTNAQISTGTTPKSPGQVRQIKKNIARILTIIGEKPKDGAFIPKGQSEKANKKSR